MSLAIKKGPAPHPPRFLVYGQEGVGKTTFGAQLPGALVVSAEDGAGDLEYDRIDITTWPELLQVVSALGQDAGGYRTVVLDSVSAFERLLHAFLCEEAGAATIEDVGGGFGKGYTQAGEAWAGFLRALDQLRLRQRVACVLLGHAEVKAFNDPTGPSYDRYQLRAHKGVVAAVTQWADGVFFCGWDTTVRTERRGKAVEVQDATKKGKATAAVRKLWTAKEPAFDAKTRYDLPGEMPLDAAGFIRAFGWQAREWAWRPPRTPSEAVARKGLDPAKVDAWLAETQRAGLDALEEAARKEALAQLGADGELRARLAFHAPAAR